MRLAKYLSLSGVASRRSSELIIRQGRVKLNGSVELLPQAAVSSGDLVTVDNQEIALVKNKDYYMVNKPAGYLSTVTDTHNRPTVIDLINNCNRRLYPVGRLDMDTSGILLLTNDGELAYRLTHPSYLVRKVYQSWVYGIPGEEKLKCIKKGIEIEGVKTAPAGVRLLKADYDHNLALIEITLTEGRKRQVKIMLAAIGHPVRTLKRISFADLDLGQLAEGTYRTLSKEEIVSLKNLVDLNNS
jgi:23S rRNA pseudouridine2605 synthase